MNNRRQREKPKSMAMLNKEHVGEATALLALFALVLVLRNYGSSASPSLILAQLHDCRATDSSTPDPATGLQSQAPAATVDGTRVGWQRHGTQPRVALCLVGGARALELTAESIVRHVMDDEYWSPDVFLHSPLDSDAHKFTLLGQSFSVASGRLAAARIFVPERIPEFALHWEVLNGGTSPKGVQGLLQYFHLVEGCVEMIAQHEDRHGFRYDWVARTRVDGFWSGPVPPLASLNASAYYVPIGSQFGGFNDRFGLGSRDVTVEALSRLSVLPLLHDLGHRNLNSESAFKAQLEELKISCETIAVPFCVLSRRKYGWPLEGPMDVPVASIGTVGALNGAKCRPCTPAATGSEAERVVSTLSKRWGWPGHVRGLELCDGSGDWEENWRVPYAEAAGRTFENQRQRVLSRTREECEADVVRFGKQWEAWDAPTAEQICSRQHSL